VPRLEPRRNSTLKHAAPPTNQSFDVHFCTVARWDDGQIVEENLFYDLVTFMKQTGLSK
jgi:hypothetical protein